MLSPQTPAVQLAGSFAAGAQAVPQFPQWFRSVVVSASQPFEPSASQSAKPALQVEPQAPAAQLAAAFAPAVHTLPQAPQFCVLVFVSTSQPFAPFTSQSAKPALHA